MNSVAAPILLQTDLQPIKQMLEVERRRMVDEIVHYPLPIPRCDVQYNTLLEERAALNRALVRLDRIEREGHSSAEDVQALAEYLTAAAFVDDAMKQRIQTSILGERI